MLFWLMLLLVESTLQGLKDGNGRAAVNITISGVGGEAINIGSSQSSDDSYEDYIDAEVLDDK